MRLVAAAAVAVSAVVHLYLWWFDNYKDIDMIGPAFMANAVGGAAIAVMLVAWRHWIPPLLALGFGISTLGAFVLSTTVGLFGVNETWDGWAVWAAAISEALAIVTGAVLVLRDNPLRSGGQLQHRLAARRAHLH